MSIVDKTAEETFTLSETGSVIPPPPAIYTTTRQNILAYRNKVMADLVGGRVEALLDAGHDSLGKYKAKLSELDITAYLYKNLRRNALAFKFKGGDIGAGIYRGIKSEWLAPSAMYPMKEPYQVPQRSLPEVDYFRFTPFSNIDTIERGNLAQLKSFVGIQVVSDTFKTTPDAENALYDFYYFYPQCRVRGRWTFTDPYEVGYEAFRAEYVLFMAELRTANIETCYVYYVYVWMDVHVERPTVTAEPTWFEPILSRNLTARREHNVWYFNSEAPVVEICIGGRRVGSDDVHLYGVKTAESFMVGYNYKANAISPTEQTSDWYNSWKITVAVNDPAKGTTNPAPDTYTRQAMWGENVQAIPTAPAVFDHWELDGVNIGNVNPYWNVALKDSTLRAVFV